MDQCDCCGRGTVEVKCPYCFKEGLPDEDKENLCMTKKEGKWSLRRDHSYFYQVQTQINVCNVEFGDFVVWTKTGMLEERIMKDRLFFEEAVNNVEHIFVYGILPEIIGKWYTRTPIANSAGVVQILPPDHKAGGDNDGQNEDLTNDDENPDKLWCFCEQPAYGNMICCDHDKCTIKWFHFDCLRICCPPKGRWYCPSCCKLPKFNRRKPVDTQ